MRPTDVAEVRVAGGWASRRRLYRALAEALLGAEPPAGVVFESTLAGPPPRICVRPARLFGGPGPIRLPGVTATVFARAPPPCEPTAGLDRIGWYGILVPCRNERPIRGPGPTLSPAPPSLEWVRGAGGWAGLQVLWGRSGTGRIQVAVRWRATARNAHDGESLYGLIGARILADWSRCTRSFASVERASRRTRGDWRRLGVRSIPAEGWTPLAPGVVEETPEVGWRDLAAPASTSGGHTIVFGASGTGKTTLLAERTVRAIADGGSAVVLDLHGDLAPAILRGLPSRVRERVVAVDAGERPVAGISGLVGSGPSVDRAAGHFVAAVKRLSPDGGDLAWGFRLERIFDTFSRLVLESGGSLLDLYALLTDPRRRDAALLEAHGPASARFLEELGPIVRRNPEFLWSAATRLSKVVLIPELAELLAPPDGGLDVERLIREGRSVLVRLPVASLGPEAAAFAATLVLGRIYLGLLGNSRGGTVRTRVGLVLDEVQGFPPRLVSEILSDSRKFGVEALVATQYPDRLAPELRAAAAGAAARFVSFRTPAASAAQVGPWVGLSATEASEVLSALPPGVAVELDADTGVPRWIHGRTPSIEDPGPGWEEALAQTRVEFGVSMSGMPPETDEVAIERILLSILASEDAGRTLAPEEVVPAASRLVGPPVDAAELERAWTRLARGPECTVESRKVRLTASGEQRVGLRPVTGAPSESSEHRALLLRAFRIFARNGHAIEILRQGRFDTTLPDALFRQLGSRPSTIPEEVARTLDRVRSGWAWRCFSGRDVHLEAEVSGALRPERIRRGISKAHARGAFALFLVGDAGRARRVRSTFRSLGLRPDRAQVWTLRPPGAQGPHVASPTEPH